MVNLFDIWELLNEKDSLDGMASTIRRGFLLWIRTQVKYLGGAERSPFVNPFSNQNQVTNKNKIMKKRVKESI